MPAPDKRTTFLCIVCGLYRAQDFLAQLPPSTASNGHKNGSESNDEICYVGRYENLLQMSSRCIRAQVGAEFSNDHKVDPKKKDWNAPNSVF